jgi:hypothetical protein
LNIVLFLGAGFSAPFGLPTMNEFLYRAQASMRITDVQKGLINKLTIQAKNANSMLDSSPVNLEDILSFSLMAERLNLDQDKESDISTRVKYALHRIYSDINNPQEYIMKIKSLDNLLNGSLEKLANRKNIKIITTNYDLVLENILYNDQVFASLPFEYDIVKSKTNLSIYRENGIPIFKLHGSV